MPFTEIYIKLVVGFPRDPKVRRLVSVCGMDAGLARDLYLAMALYCKENLTDGWVPAEEVGALAYPLPADHANQLAKQLASVGLTKEVSKNEAQGWELLAYLRRNGSRDDAEQLSKVRAEAGRTGGRKSRKRPAQRPSQASSKQVGNQVGKQNASNTVSVSVVPNGTTEDRDIVQTPTVSAGEMTITQRSKRLTDAYADAVPMCKWVAVNGVVLSAVKSGKFSDDEIRAALLRLAADNRPVTIDSLRTELIGITPRAAASRGTPSEPGSAADQRRAEVARLREIDRQQREGHPSGTIQGSVIT
jgi:hypothetical protein